MTATAFKAKHGLETIIEGDASSLAIALGSAVDAANRTGFYSDLTTPGSEELGVVVGGNSVIVAHAEGHVEVDVIQLGDTSSPSVNGQATYNQTANRFEFYENGVLRTLGGISGPVTSTDNAVARWDGVGGDTLQDSSVLIDDSDNITGVADLSISGDLTLSGYTADRITFTNGSSVLSVSNDLTWDGSTLDVTGDITFSGTLTGGTYAGDPFTALAEAQLLTGFPNKTDSTISFVDGTRTFTIQPTGASFTYYQDDGTEYTVSSSDDVVITDVEGLHYIYYDGATLTAVANPSVTDVLNVIYTYALVAVIYWDATNNKRLILGDERHGFMPPQTHAWLHYYQGTQLETGGSLGDILTDESGDDDTHCQFSNASTRILDEDQSIDVGTRISTANIAVWWREGASGDWREDATRSFPVTNSAGSRADWNEWTGVTWQRTEITNNDFFLVTIFATSDVDGKYVAIMGQADYPNRNQARQAAPSELANLILDGLPAPEMYPLGTFIVQSGNGMSNTPKSKFVSDGDGNDYIDWRNTDVGIGTGTSPSSHNVLTDRDAINSHPIGAIDASTLTEEGLCFVSSGLITNSANLTWDGSTLDVVGTYQTTGRWDLDVTGGAFNGTLIGSKGAFGTVSLVTWDSSTTILRFGASLGGTITGIYGSSVTLYAGSKNLIELDDSGDTYRLRLNNADIVDATSTNFAINGTGSVSGQLTVTNLIQTNHNASPAVDGAFCYNDTATRFEFYENGVLVTLGGGGDVTAAANITDHAIVRGDGGAKGVQDSGILIDDSDNITAVNDLTYGGVLYGTTIDTGAASDLVLKVNGTSYLHMDVLGGASYLVNITPRYTYDRVGWQNRFQPTSPGTTSHYGATNELTLYLSATGQQYSKSLENILYMNPNGYTHTTGNVAACSNRVICAGNSGTSLRVDGLECLIQLYQNHTVDQVRALSITIAQYGTTNVNYYNGINIEGSSAATIGVNQKIGILVGNMSGSTINRAIKTGTGPVEFGDDLYCNTIDTNAASNLFLKYNGTTVETISNGYNVIDGYTIWRSQTASQPQNVLYNYTTGATAPYLSMRKARGTIASPSAISSGDFLGNISMGGYINAGWRENARIFAQAVAAPSGNYVDTEVAIWVDDGASGIAEIAAFGSGGLAVASGLLTSGGTNVQSTTFGEIYGYSDSISANNVTWTVVDALDTDGESNDCTNDAANNRIQITRTGKYKITFEVSYETVSAGSSSYVLTCPFWNGSRLTRGTTRVDFAISDQGYVTVSKTFYADITTANLYLDLRQYHASGSTETIAQEYANLTCERMGDT